MAALLMPIWFCMSGDPDYRIMKKEESPGSHAQLLSYVFVCEKTWKQVKKNAAKYCIMATAAGKTTDIEEAQTPLDI